MKHYVVAGLGISGLSVIHYLKKQKIQVTVLDHRPSITVVNNLLSLYPDIIIHAGPFKLEILKQADEIILSPGISPHHPDLLPIQGKISIINDVELFARKVKAPVVAITGSNAKSTVTSLVGEMARAAHIRVGIGGNLGIPVLSLLESQYDLYVLELSSFQLELIESLKPQVATILNLSVDHLDRHQNFENYCAAKQRIFLGAEQAVINREDKTTLELLPRDIPFTTFGSDNVSIHFGMMQHQGETWLSNGKPLLPTSALKIQGLHNAMNGLAALALGSVINLPLATMIETLRNFKGLPHRCSWVAEKHNVVWINDSKATNVAASIAAIEGLGPTISGQWILIAGGEGKNADFSLLKKVVGCFCKAVVLIGKDAPLLYEVLHTTVACYFTPSMESAVEKAAILAKQGDGVLLSPACASFDMFKNFEHRGQVFEEAVKVVTTR